MKTVQQPYQLLKIKSLTNNQIPVTDLVPDWSNQTVQGKVFIPQFAKDSPVELLEMLKPESSLYVLTFLRNSCPSKIKVGYTSPEVNKYYLSTLRC